LRSSPPNAFVLSTQDLQSEASAGNGVRVGIIDTGADVRHHLLSHAIEAVKNFTHRGNKSDVSDDVGHGTGVAGVIAGAPGMGFKGGVAPNARLFIAKAGTIDRFTASAAPDVPAM
jgi:major intracellular serine protease